MNTSVSQFYSSLAFPGHYTFEQLNAYGTPIENYYLNLINRQLGAGLTVLDAGCGTGLTTNLFAIRNPDSKFLGVDFSDSVKWANTFAQTNNIANVKFQHADLTRFNPGAQFDRVICQGVLHHIPLWQRAITRLMDAVRPGGQLILGLYHPAGKLIKKFVEIDYRSRILHIDQEENPFEISFTLQDVQAMTPGFKLLATRPSIMSNIAIPAFFNYRNGGLTIYILEKTI
jgi:SAM-dependent methyltransferase